MAVDFKTFNSFVDVIANAKYPVMLRGRHGIGKSELVYQFAAKRGLPIVERRASQMTEGDLVGLPVIDGDTTSWNPPDWYKQACREPVVLFMDEIDRATTEVRQGFFQLADSRTLNGHRLHPDTLLFAAVNGGVHAAQYQVNDMDPAELDRWTVFDVEPSVDDWLDYARNRVNPIIVEFITNSKADLEHTKDFEPGKIYPSRRSWERLSRTIDAANLLNSDNFKKNLSVVYNLACGFLGFETAVRLRDFAEKYENQVVPQDILDGKAFKNMKSWKLNDHISMVDKLLTSGLLNENMEQEHIENVARYFFKAPSEAGMKFYTGLSGDKVLMSFLLRMHKLKIDGKDVRHHMVSMLATKKEEK